MVNFINLLSAVIFWCPDSRCLARAAVESRNIAKVLNQESERYSKLNIVSFHLADVLVRALTFSLYVDNPEDDFFKRTSGHSSSWPLHAVSMGGTGALWNLVELLDIVLTEKVPGNFVETGAWKGANGILVKKLLEQSGDTKRKVYQLDSFDWLPPPERKFKADIGDKHHLYAKSNPVLRASFDDVRANFERFGIDPDKAETRVKLVKGFFNVTIPPLSEKIGPIAILRLDGDMYQSTFEALNGFYYDVSIGGFVIVDDWQLRGCRQAITDFMKCMQISEPVSLFEVAYATRSTKITKAFWRKMSQPATRKCSRFE